MSLGFQTSQEAWFERRKGMYESRSDALVVLTGVSLIDYKQYVKAYWLVNS